VADLLRRPVAVGIILGLGLSFMLDGAKLMAAGWWLSGPALRLALLLLTNRIIPAMFLLLAGGTVVALIRDPTLLTAIGKSQFKPRFPSFALGSMAWSELVIGTLFLARRCRSRWGTRLSQSPTRTTAYFPNGGCRNARLPSRLG
jgi:hypothetical protein